MVIIKKIKIFISIILTVMILCVPAAAFASSKSTANTLSLTRLFGVARTQDAYLPDRNVSNLDLRNPESIAFGADGLLYIADTGNRRILVFDTVTNRIAFEIRHREFANPRGVYLTRDNTLYVADSGASSVFVFDGTGEYIRTFTEPPDMPLLDVPFEPVRIAVDERGNMFIVGQGVLNGIIHLSKDGEFMGFFASNNTNLTLLQRLQNIFFTDRQLEGLAARNPLTFSNITLDSRGIVYTTTMGSREALQNQGVKRHDMSGRNTFENAFIWFTNLVDVVVDDNGIIFIADTSGYIDVLTGDADLIFRFGASSNENIAGHFRRLSSIAVSDTGHIWALDGENGFLQSFTPTEYALSVYEAITLFNAGLYDESGYVWEEVLRRNQMSVLAHDGMGRAHLYRQNYENAMHHFYLSGNRFYYSMAYWELRNMWLIGNAGLIIIAIFIFFAAMSVVKYFDKKRTIKTAISSAKAAVTENRWLSPVFFAFSVARHPLNSFYYLKLKEKGNYLGALFHFILFFIAYMTYQTSKGFIVQYINVEFMDFIAVIGSFYGLIILFILSNFLVTSIKGGEGGLGLIFKTVSYASFPMTLTLFAITIVSHVITMNEVFLLNFMFLAGFTYFVVIMWLGLMEIHNYSFGTNFKSLLITVFFMLIALVAIYIVTILIGEIISFFDSIVWEVRAIVWG